MIVTSDPLVLTRAHPLLQLGPAQRLFAPSLADQGPEPVATAEFQLLLVQAFDSDHERDRSAVAEDNDSIPLGLYDTAVQGHLTEIYDYHRILIARVCALTRESNALAPPTRPQGCTPPPGEAGQWLDRGASSG